ncbi:NAD(P)-binding protein [Cystobasidium minutum MCA 4210]|uniref:NAD(P)-binding protein n=1 Tax=Cystobasidium minutum MCA 4210 TaxID=1397322 RepID=UPI0034CE0D94|eukprot:jgi/Rhomi1/198493/gm1.6707_g
MLHVRTRLPQTTSVLTSRWLRFASSRARALVYTDRGEPTNVLQGLSYDLPPLKSDEVRVRFRYSPQNPADLNVIQGSYPERAPPSEIVPKSAEGKPYYIAGSEGFATVEELPKGDSSGLKVGDWVIMGKSQQGTWSSRSNLPLDGQFPIARSSSSTLSEIQAATLGINPPTAYRMLTDYETLQPGDWVIQNGGNSQVGLAVIQLAKEWGFKTVNFVRDRENIEDLRQELQELGADHVVTYSELADKSFRKKLAEWTGGAPIKLGLNCVGGQDTSNMAKLLSPNATLVTYGAMSMQPLSLPSSLFIFKNLKSVGFWMSEWYKRFDVNNDERKKMTDELVKMMEEGKMRAPKAEIVELKGSDEDVGRIAREAIKDVKGKKIVFTFPDE